MIGCGNNEVCRSQLGILQQHSAEQRFCREAKLNAKKRSDQLVLYASAGFLTLETYAALVGPPFRGLAKSLAANS